MCGEGYYYLKKKKFTLRYYFIVQVKFFQGVRTSFGINEKILQSHLRDYNKTGIQMLLTTNNSSHQVVHFRLCTAKKWKWQMARSTSKEAQALIHSLRLDYAATPSTFKVSFSVSSYTNINI